MWQHYSRTDQRICLTLLSCSLQPSHGFIAKPFFLWKFRIWKIYRDLHIKIEKCLKVGSAFLMIRSINQPRLCKGTRKTAKNIRVLCKRRVECYVPHINANQTRAWCWNQRSCPYPSAAISRRAYWWRQMLLCCRKGWGKPSTHRSNNHIHRQRQTDEGFYDGKISESGHDS